MLALSRNVVRRALDIIYSPQHFVALRWRTYFSPSFLRDVLAVCGIALFLSVSPVKAQASYPDRPIRFVVAFAAGGITDIVARLVGEALSARIGQTVIVDNRGGAAGGLGAGLVVNSKPDGYTVLVTTTAVAIRAAAIPSPADPLAHLTPIAMAAATPTIFLARAPAGADRLSEFLKAKGGRVTFASAGAGTAEHLTAAYAFMGVPGLEATHVPYKSGGETVTAVMGGHVDIAITSPPTSMSYIRDGKIKILGIATDKRSAMSPEVPTLAEMGLVEGENSSWIALFGPPGLPKDIAEKLTSEVNYVLKQPALRERLLQLGFEPHAMSQAEFASYIQKEVLKWRKIIDATGTVLQ